MAAALGVCRVCAQGISTDSFVSAKEVAHVYHPACGMILAVENAIVDGITSPLYEAPTRHKHMGGRAYLYLVRTASAVQGEIPDTNDVVEAGGSHIDCLAYMSEQTRAKCNMMAAPRSVPESCARLLLNMQLRQASPTPRDPAACWMKGCSIGSALYQRYCDCGHIVCLPCAFVLFCAGHAKCPCTQPSGVKTSTPVEIPPDEYAAGWSGTVSSLLRNPASRSDFMMKPHLLGITRAMKNANPALQALPPDHIVDGEPSIRPTVSTAGPH